MSCSSNCPCKQSQKTPFYCHCSGEPYSQKFIIPLGHEGCARIYNISNPDILGIGIEQAITGGGQRVERDANNKCRIVCLKTRETWYSYKDVNCCDTNQMVIYRPWLLTPQGDCKIILPAGCFRFVAYNCDYDLVVPGAQDIAMMLTIEKC